MKQASTLLLFIFIIQGSVTGQPISKVSEVYDYEIGDIFHYRRGYNSYSMGDGYWTMTLSNMTILDKFSSDQGDTLFYKRHIDWMFIDLYYHDTSWGSDQDMLAYTNLDSLIYGGDIDSVYSVDSLYNGRIINYYYSGTWDNFVSVDLIEGCGGPYGQTYVENGYYDYSNTTTTLLYYRKGDEEWGEPHPLNHSVIGDIPLERANVYPNPAKDFIRVSKGSTSRENVIISIYSVSGALALRTLGAFEPVISVDISNLHAGVYVIDILTRDRRLTGRFIKTGRQSQ